MRHVITGGAGFVGRNLAKALLARGDRVVVFDLVAPEIDDVDFLPGDVRDKEDIARLALAPSDVVYHLAARQFHGSVPRRGRDAWFADVNVGGTERLIEAMAVGGARRLVFFSTDMTYGIPDATPVLPSHRQNPLGPYGRSKLKAEQFLLRASCEGMIDATVFRPRLIAGAGRLGVLVTLFKLIRNHLPVPLIGDGRNCYQMVAVEDCVAAALAAVDHSCPAGPFNLGSADPPTVRALLGSLIARAGSRSLLLATPSKLVQPVLDFLDRIGATLLYPEQFAIANLNYILDTGETTRTLDWTPRRSDADILFDAYTEYLRLSRHAG